MLNRMAKKVINADKDYCSGGKVEEREEEE